MILCFENLIDLDGSVLSASSQNAQFPVANLKNLLLAKVWKSVAGDAVDYIDFNMSAPPLAPLAGAAATACVIAGHNFNGTEVVKLLGDPTNTNWASPTFSQTFTLKSRFPSAVAAPWPDGASLNTMITFTTKTFAYWRIEITKAHSSEVKQVGRVYLGTSYDTGDPGDPDYGNYSRGFNEMANIEKSIMGQTYAERRALYDTPQAAVGPIPESVMKYLRYYLRAVGLSMPWFFRLSATDPLDTPYYVRQASPMTEQLVEFGDSFLYNVNFDLEEQL